MLRLLVPAACLLAAPAYAQTAGTCSDHETMVRHLAEGWGESRQSIALDGANAMVELYASSETGTWTLVVTTPGGPSCMVASGHSFETLAEPLPVLDHPA